MLEEILQIQYSKSNYRIERISDKNRCIIFCSSNGLWQPHNEEVFAKWICEQDRYEWENVAKAKQIREHFGKVIYIRDIYKHFYVEGINKQINTIDKLIEFLKPETSNYELTVVGNSAGGYLACILGARLKAQKVFSFGGQFDLRSWGGANGIYTFTQYEFLTKHLNNEECAKYYDIRNMLTESKVKVFHFYSAYNEADCVQASLVKDSGNIYLYKFEEKTHGRTMWGVNMPYVFCLENDALIKLYNKFKNKVIKKFMFSISSMGIGNTIRHLVYKTMRRLRIAKGKGK